ncbi:hypothetical protein BH11MYX1_BH11MYX1_03420 [soil metagenome]
MRLWIASLLVGAGCNQIFGTGDVHLHVDDAAPLIDGHDPYPMRITGMAFNSAKVADPTTVAVTYPVANVTVELGAMPDPGASGFPALAAPVAVDATGAFRVPFELALADYRIVYHPPDGVPVELQSRLHAAAHFIVGIDLGRPERIAAPANASMSIGPAGTPNPFTAARLIETGSWATHYVGSVPGGQASSFSTDWSTTLPSQGTPVTSQAGGLSSPETTKGDRLLLVDATDPSALGAGLANAYSVITMDGFNGSTANNLLAGMWTTVATATPPMTAANYTKEAGFAPAEARVNAATRFNGPSANDNPVGGANFPFVWSGVIPSASLPNFVTSGAGGKAIPPAQANGIGGVGVPTFAFMSTQASSAQLPYVNIFDGTIAPKFPQAIFARFSRSRLTSNVKITEGIQTISLTSGSPATAKVDLAVGLAYLAGSHMKLAGTEIWDANSGSALVPRAALMPFGFGVDGPVDDCVATLYSVTSNAFVPVRRYLMPATVNHGAPSGIVVDGSILSSSQDYVFGVVCHLGYPDAVTGDWSTVTYPFSESTLYSFPFVITG